MIFRSFESTVYNLKLALRLHRALLDKLWEVKGWAVAFVVIPVVALQKDRAM